MAKNFSGWTKWSEKHSISGGQFPGVYAIAISDQDIAGTPFSLRPEIVYFGMTNSKGGLKSRLQQFDNTIRGKCGHGGANRVRYKYHDYNRLVLKLFVSICPYECTVDLNTPLAADLRVMGNVARHEYVCLAEFVEAFGRQPEFNDKKRSPKD